jgi:hypothetical protein
VTLIERAARDPQRKRSGLQPRGNHDGLGLFPSSLPPFSASRATAGVQVLERPKGSHTCTQTLIPVFNRTVVAAGTAGGGMFTESGLGLAGRPGGRYGSKSDDR